MSQQERSEAADRELLQEYLTVKSAYEPKVIPGGGRWTFSAKITGIPQLWTLGEGGEPVQFAQTDDRTLSVHYAPQGGKFVVGVDNHGNEKQQLYLARDLDRPSFEPLVHSPEHFHHVGGWSPDGRYLSYSSNRRHPGFFDIFVVDTDSGESRSVLEYDGNCAPLGWVDENSLLVSIRETNLDSTVYRLDIHTGARLRVGPEGVLARYETIKVNKNGTLAYALTDLGEENLYVASFSPESPHKLTKLLQAEGWDIEEIALSPDERTLAFTVNEGGFSRLGFFDPASDREERAAGLPGGVIESIAWLSDDVLLFSLKSPVLPGDIWSCDRSAQKAERLTRIGHSDAIADRLVDAELCAFKSFDGLEVPYFFYNRSAAEDKPAVVYVHGGPESQIKAEYHPVLQYLVDRGFAVAAPNVRGSSGYGRTYIQLDDADKRMDSVRDLAELTRDLTANRGVHPGRIGVIGRSYGGFMVLAAVTHYPDLWAAGVDIVGISNLKTLLANTGEWRRRLRECEYGALDVYSDFFDEIAPLHHAEKITAPLLVFHGRNDTRVPVSEAEQLVDGMEKRGQTVELVIFEDEGHQTERLENHMTMHGKSVEFFERYLGGDVVE
ncbi:alpha/beta fold hydrolase [Saccharibacillus sp. CPCC 101409]|uniref:S9 family peptidase n=1 Tax=Saccharibacillus sp. CPCC 101409 TaxID=3058041 RepID=UPI0026728BC2|nr:alpha/beta fold hydrolase [Saccharibacillus sp. CPCC 101409]MDO3410344.1 alpha/beta fold hydrolase [Saccharibacillus sp. CPCC 101409]